MALSIKTKIWLPAIALSIGLVLMSTGSAVRTVKSQAITVKEQSDQQSKLEMASRWRGLAEAQALRTLGAALASDEASAALLQGGQEQALQELTQVQSALSALLTNTMERAALWHRARSGAPCLAVRPARPGACPGCHRGCAPAARPRHPRP